MSATALQGLAASNDTNCDDDFTRVVDESPIEYQMSRIDLFGSLLPAIDTGKDL